MKTVVLGSGGWGTALSLVLHRNGHPVTLWSHVPEKAAYMERARENPRLEGVPLPPELRLTADMACLTEAELVVVAVPSYAVRETAHAAAPLLRPDTLLVTAAKGIERDTHLRMSQILEQETGGAFPIAALSGPSHAEEVGRGLPTGCVAASVSQAAALTVQDAFMNDRFRVYTSPDIVGVELSGALKNVVALACGICDGMGYQDNTKALLMTRAMVELCHLGERLGGDRQTFGGLAGMGDLIVTCTSMHSRNRRAGILLGQGKSVGQTLAETGGVVEGYYAAASMHQLAEKTGFSQEDAAVVKECLRTLFVNDASAARPEGSMEVVKLFWWEHNCKEGQYSSAKVHRSVHVTPKNPEGIPTCVDDYEITLDELPGLVPEIIDGV